MVLGLLVLNDEQVMFGSNGSPFPQHMVTVVFKDLEGLEISAAACDRLDSMLRSQGAVIKPARIKMDFGEPDVDSATFRDNLEMGNFLPVFQRLHIMLRCS